MKKQNTKPTVQDIFPDIKTPQHTQGDKPQKKDFCSPSIAGKNFVRVDYRGYVKALESYITKNEKAVNMHDELIELLAWARKVIDASVPKQAGYGAVEILPKIEQVLKQAEGK